MVVKSICQTLCAAIGFYLEDHDWMMNNFGFGERNLGSLVSQVARKIVEN